jgi:hypothetical protein
MKIGTRSIFFGVHQFLIHPWFVAWGWWKLYGFPWDPRLWMAFFVHDLGYFGKPNMDGPEGERHIWLGAKIMGDLFDPGWPLAGGVAWVIGSMCDRVFGVIPPRDGNWFSFCFYHSRFVAKHYGIRPSRLCAADKLAIALMPTWLYLPLAWLTGELREYMRGDGARTPAGDRSAGEWLADVRAYCREWAFEHKDGREDLWTGTVRDLGIGYESERTKP